MYTEQELWLWSSNIFDPATARIFLYKFIDVSEDLAFPSSEKIFIGLYKGRRQKVKSYISP